MFKKPGKRLKLWKRRLAQSRGCQAMKPAMPPFSSVACRCLGHRGWHAAPSSARGWILRSPRWLKLRASVRYQDDANPPPPLDQVSLNSVARCLSRAAPCCTAYAMDARTPPEQSWRRMRAGLLRRAGAHRPPTPLSAPRLDEEGGSCWAVPDILTRY